MGSALKTEPFPLAVGYDVIGFFRKRIRSKHFTNAHVGLVGQFLVGPDANKDAWK